MVRANLSAVAALLLAGALGLRLADGSALAIVQGWYQPLLVVSGVLLAALATVVAVQSLAAREEWTPRMTPRDLIGIGLVLTPILFAILIVPSPLSGSDLDSTTSSQALLLAERRSDLPTAERNLLQWAAAFATAAPEEIIGQDVDLVAFVYRRAGEANMETFLAARFAVACCVADALGITLPIRWQHASALPADSWVHIRGAVARSTDGTLVVDAQAVDRIDAPKNPYLYP